MYESFYNFTSKPFALTPDPAFYYGSKEHSRVLAYLRYGISQSEGFIVVSGDIGAGKTMLVGALLEELGKNEDIITAQLVTTQLQPDDLIRMVAGSFGLHYKNKSKSELLKEIETFLHEQATKGKRTLLIVDEAQNLERHSLEELRMLSNFQYKQKSLLQSFLLGQAEFRDTLRTPGLEQFRQRIIASYHLGPMAKSEIKPYIEHRLKVAGWRGDPQIENQVYSEIYTNTDGIPRRINTLCDRIFVFIFAEDLHEISLDTVRKVINELDEELHFNKEENISSSNTESTSGAATYKDKSANPDSLEERVERLEVLAYHVQSFIKNILK